MEINADRAQLKRLTDDPVWTYFELRNEARLHLAHGHDDFPFTLFKTILEKIILDLQNRKNDAWQTQINDVLAEAKKLNSNGPPFRATHRFIMLKYLPLMDRLFCELHPEYKDLNFHRTNAEPLLEKALALAPDLLPIYTFEPLMFDFFLRTRTIPMPALGISLTGLAAGEPPPFADRFAMKTSEFTWHDWGHLEGMARRDLKHIQHSGKPAERVIAEWDVTKSRILTYRNTYKEKNRDLYDAMDLILMEFLHERGFQYSLTVLKNELDTPKWLEIILRKKERGFFDSFRHNIQAFTQLESARQHLLEAIEKFRIEDQLQWCRTLRADLVPVKITHTPALQYDKGSLVSIELNGMRAICTLRNNEGVHLTASFDDLVLAQVDPVQESLWTKELIRQVRAALGGDRLKSNVQAIVLKPQRKLTALLTDGSPVPLEQITLSDLGEYPNILPSIEIFEIEQVLGASERGELISFTIPSEIKIYSGRVSKLDHVANSKTKAEIRQLSNQGTIELPLVEIRIDPLSST